MNDLIYTYQQIADTLKSKAKDDSSLLGLLANDYAYIAVLLEGAVAENDVAWFIEKLRRDNLDRRHVYPYSEKRNATIQVVANTIARYTQEETNDA